MATTLVDEKIYSKYSEYTDFPVHYERLKWIYNVIHNQRDPNKMVKILDVGCGTGNVTIPLGTIPNSEILGIDVHQGNIDISVERNKFDNVKFKFEYLQDCDISDFDFIILTEVLEHIPGYMEILKYIAEKGKPTVQFLLTIPNGRGPFEISQQPLYLMRRMGMNGFIWKVKNLLGKKEPYSQNYDTPHVNFFTIKQLKKDFDSINMKMAEIVNAHVLSPVIETYLPFIPLKTFADVDNAIAQKLPKALGSGWYFRIVFK